MYNSCQVFVKSPAAALTPLPFRHQATLHAYPYTMRLFMDYKLLLQVRTIIVHYSSMLQAHCDYIDFNLGCPQRIAKRGFYGAFLMDDLKLVQKLVISAVENLSVPISCKIRLFPDLNKTLEYAKMLEASGCSLLAVHGRTREMKDTSAHRADWDAIKAVRAAVRIPVLANGDVRTIHDAQRLMQYTGADGVMSAEPLLVDPALFDDKRLEPEVRHTCPILSLAVVGLLVTTVWSGEV